jgi:high-affinity nickel-transport protein
VDVAGDHYDIIGGCIVGSFLIFGVISVLAYKPWRRMIDRKRSNVLLTDEDGETTNLGEVEILDDQLVDTSTDPQAHARESDSKKQNVKTDVQPIGESSRDA